MSALFVVLPLVLGIVLCAVIAYAWAARSGQFDDLDTPAIRMLHDDTPESPRAQGSGSERDPASAP